MANEGKYVEIEGVIFAIDKIPNAETALVLNAKDSLLGAVDLKSLVTDLNKLGNFMRIAYNGVAGHTELHIKVQHVCFKVTKLADKSAVIVHSFKTTSRDVLQELQGAYGYLLDGLEDMALATFSGLAALAEKMAKASEELHKDFEAATNDVEYALVDTLNIKGTEVERKKELKKQQEEFKLELDKAQQERKDADEAERKAEKFYYEAEKRQDKAYDDYGHIMTTLTDAVSKAFITLNSYTNSLNHAFEKWAQMSPMNRPLNHALEQVANIGDKSTYKDAMEKAREEKVKHLEITRKQQERRRKANQQCIEFAERIKICESDDDLQKVVIDALHKSVGALKSLSLIMMNAAQFWKQMKNHCENLAGKQLQKDVEIAMKLDDAKRLKVWTSSAFKKKAMNYYAKWVALGEVCGTYMQQIKRTRADLYKHLEENPTIEESRENVRDMASTFIKEMKEEQDDIDQEDLKTAQKIKELKP